MQLKKNAGAYSGHLAVFTWGGADTEFGPAQQRNAALATAAGFDVKTAVIAGASHTGPAVHDGYGRAIALLGEKLGLGTTPK